jgi:hypothetical protein
MGRLVRFLSDPPPGAQDRDPVVRLGPSGSRIVAFVRSGKNPCHAEVMQVPLAGRPSATVVLRPADTAIGQIGASRHGNTLAVDVERCSEKRSFDVVRVYRDGRHHAALTLSARLPADSNNRWSVGPIGVWHRLVAVWIGEHSVDGTVLYRVAGHASTRKIDSGRFLPTPRHRFCAEAALLPSDIVHQLVWSMTIECECERGDRETSPNVLISYPWPHLRRFTTRHLNAPPAALPYPDLSGTDGTGHLIGARTNDAGDTAIVMTDGTHEVDLPTCPASPVSKAARCPRHPVW